MVDEIKGIRDQVLRSLIASVTTRIDPRSGEKTDDSAGIDARTAKDLIGMIATWAGKGKDEIVQVLCREIGVAIAAVVKEPLEQVLEDKRLVISFELAPKSRQAESEPSRKKKKTARTKSKKKT